MDIDLLCEPGHAPPLSGPRLFLSPEVPGTRTLPGHLRTRVETQGLQVEKRIGLCLFTVALWGEQVPNHYLLPYGSQLEPGKQVQHLSQRARETEHPCCASSGHFSKSQGSEATLPRDKPLRPTSSPDMELGKSSHPWCLVCSQHPLHDHQHHKRSAPSPGRVPTPSH